MKTISKILTLFMVLTLLANCSKDDDGGGDNNPTGSCYDKLIIATMDFNDTYQAFNETPSEATCSALKTAALGLIEAFDDCPQYLEDEGNADLQEAAQEWTDLDCSEF